MYKWQFVLEHMIAVGVLCLVCRVEFSMSPAWFSVVSRCARCSLAFHCWYQRRVRVISIGRAGVRVLAARPTNQTVEIRLPHWASSSLDVGDSCRQKPRRVRVSCRLRHFHLFKPYAGLNTFHICIHKFLFNLEREKCSYFEWFYFNKSVCVTSAAAGNCSIDFVGTRGPRTPQM